MKSTQSLDTAFRVGLKLSFRLTGRHCHFESCLGKQEKSQSQVVIGHIFKGVVSQSQAAVWLMSETSLRKRKPVQILAAS